MPEPNRIVELLQEIKDLLVWRFGSMATVAAGGETFRPTPLAPRDIDREWLTVKDAAKRARCGHRVLYREAEAGRIKVARIGGRRELRFKPEWVDKWLESQS